MREYSFGFLEEELKQKKLTLEDTMIKFNLLNSDRKVTSIGELFSDQNKLGIEIIDMMNLNRQKIDGSLIHQFKEMEKIISELKSYPIESIRESICNAIIHRDYTVKGDTIVKIYNDRIEIISLGEIPSNISPKGLTLGISVCRNDEIMEVFRYLGITSKIGKGIEKILREYKEYKLEPTIESLGGVYRITLPKISYTINGVIVKKTYRKILDILDEKGTITNEELQTLIGLTSSGVIKNLKEMLEIGLIEKIREGRNISYRIKISK